MYTKACDSFNKFLPLYLCLRWFDTLLFILIFVFSFYFIYIYNFFWWEAIFIIFKLIDFIKNYNFLYIILLNLFNYYDLY